MPFNLLLLPLLAGFLFLARSNLRSYEASQLQKEQLIFTAAASGLIFLAISRIIVVLALQTFWGQAIGALLHSIAPFPYVGTAVLTLILAWIAWRASNFFLIEAVAGIWLYHKGNFDSLTRILWQAFLGVKPQHQMMPSEWTLLCRMAWRITLRSAELVAFNRKMVLKNPLMVLRIFKAVRNVESIELSGMPVGSPRHIMLNLADSKVIVGLITDLSAKSRPAFITVLPVWTGYRDPETRSITKTVDYADALTRADDPDDLKRVIPISDIQSATIWSESAFDIPDTSAPIPESPAS